MCKVPPLCSDHAPNMIACYAHYAHIGRQYGLSIVNCIVFDRFLLRLFTILSNPNPSTDDKKVLKRANRPRSVRDLCAKPWIHILRIWFLYRMGLAIGLIENLARFINRANKIYNSIIIIISSSSFNIIF